MNLHQIVIICGPTATGKTALALELANVWNGEVVNADSRQVYKQMNIITGKDLPQGMLPQNIQISFEKSTNQTNHILVPRYLIESIPVWLYDVVSPDQTFSVAQYIELARIVIDDILKRGKLPIIVGGTGLYLQAIAQGIASASIARNTILRQEIEEFSVPELQKRLRELNPVVFARMNHSDQHNPRRLIRKIEIVSSPSIESSPPPYTPLWVGLTAEKSELEQRIATRVTSRLSIGAIQEITSLREAGYPWDCQAMQAIGYREWQSYFDDPSPEAFQAAVSAWTLHEFQYAKRQITWFKKNHDIQWFSADTLAEDVVTTIKQQIRS